MLTLHWDWAWSTDKHILYILSLSHCHSLSHSAWFSLCLSLILLDSHSACLSLCLSLFLFLSLSACLYISGLQLLLVVWERLPLIPQRRYYYAISIYFFWFLVFCCIIFIFINPSIIFFLLFQVFSICFSLNISYSTF